MADKTLKCAWCGKVVGLTKNGQRPRPHKNGQAVCVGSGMAVTQHAWIRQANDPANRQKEK